MCVRVCVLCSSLVVVMSSLPASSSPSSSASRLAIDPLSHVLSFLGTNAFIAAIGVCKGWRAAAERGSAWPTWDLEAVKHALDSGAEINEAYSDSERLIKVPTFSDRARCIYVDLTEKIRPIGNGETRLLASDGITRTTESRVWQQAQDVRVHCMGGYKAPDVTLKQLMTGFPRLKLLLFSLMDYDRDLMADCLKSLNPRIEALIAHCVGTYLSYSLRWLHNLRLLATHSIVSTELRFLHKLESLYLHDCYLDGAVIAVVSELSVKRRLRRFLISYSIDVNLALLMPAEHPHVPRKNDAALSGPFDSDPALLESISVKAPITPTTLHVLFRLPRLQHLEVGLKMDPPSVMLGKLTAELPPSHTLTSLHLHCQLGAKDIELLAQCAPQLRALNCNGLGVRPIPALSKLCCLEHLILVCNEESSQSLNAEFMSILAALPCFQRLSIRGKQARTLSALSPTVVRCIAASRSFVRIDTDIEADWLRSQQLKGPLRNLTAEEQMQLLRLRVHGAIFRQPSAVFALEREAGFEAQLHWATAPLQE